MFITGDIIASVAPEDGHIASKRYVYSKVAAYTQLSLDYSVS